MKRVREKDKAAAAQYQKTSLSRCNMPKRPTNPTLSQTPKPRPKKQGTGRGGEAWSSRRNGPGKRRNKCSTSLTYNLLTRSRCGDHAQFLVTEKGFDKERVRKGAEKPQKVLNGKRQGRLDGFFCVNNQSRCEGEGDKAEAKTSGAKKAKLKKRRAQPKRTMSCEAIFLDGSLLPPLPRCAFACIT
ncbi:hypothetical protein Hypma_016461 [Hypsizygus marmoreus]|uniref:Uncharacterized protein n=1 Tax=Hypsizygus marmoreus TaxID=39966 RepID=A0A369IZL8_HYPMA|nr:hypothetical protein Hypma_016461 [Hypsizygus marmoreus]